MLRVYSGVLFVGLLTVLTTMPADKGVTKSTNEFVHKSQCIVCDGARMVRTLDRQAAIADSRSCNKKFMNVFKKAGYGALAGIVWGKDMVSCAWGAGFGSAAGIVQEAIAEYNNWQHLKILLHSVGSDDVATHKAMLSSARKSHQKQPTAQVLALQKEHGTMKLHPSSIHHTRRSSVSR